MLVNGLEISFSLITAGGPYVWRCDKCHERGIQQELYEGQVKLKCNCGNWAYLPKPLGGSAIETEDSR